MTIRSRKPMVVFNLGFLISQQYDKNGDPIQDLVLTRDVALIEKGTNLRVTRYSCSDTDLISLHRSNQETTTFTSVIPMHC